MPSERGRLLFVPLIAAVVPACDSQDRRITDICEMLERCTLYVDAPRCGEMIADGLKDRRIADGEMARCSECLGDHRDSFDPPPRSPDPEDCYDLLVDRDCDRACAAVPLAMRVRTAPAMRAEMCTEVESACGKGDGASCEDRLESEIWGLALEAQLALDERIADCRSCVVAPSRTSSMSGATDVEECGALLDACRERCRQVRAVNRIFEVAADLVSVCRNDVSCFELPAGGAGAPAAAGAGGMRSPVSGTCMQRVRGWVQGEDSRGGSSGAGGTGGSGDAACDPAGGTQAGSAGAPLCDASARRGALAECALCVAPLGCDAIPKPCGSLCSAITGVR